MFKSLIIDEVAGYLKPFLKEKLPNELLFHNYHHTEEVVKAGKNIGLTSEELEIVLLAAWYHDAGYCSTYKNHEDESKKMATIFLTANQYPKDKMKMVTDCIEATVTHSILIIGYKRFCVMQTFITWQHLNMISFRESLEKNGSSIY